MVNPQPAQSEVEQILSTALTWEKILVTCLFCYDNNGEPTRFWVTHNEYRCPECGKRGNLRDLPMVMLDGSTK